MDNAIKNEIIIPICEVTCCIIFILSFIHIGMTSSSFHQLLKFFNSENSLNSYISFGDNFFILTLFFSLLLIALFWIIKDQRLIIFIPVNSISRRRLILILMTAAVCISIVPLFISWSTANPNVATWGGIIPYVDASSYYNGAEHFLDSGKLNEWNQRRPLNAVLLSERLLFTNFDLRNALILQAVIFGFIAFFAALTVARTLGRIAGLVMFAGLFAFAAPYIPTMFSEILGISLGALGFTLLWLGVNDKKKGLFCIGIIILTFALLARAGAMFVLPALVIYSGYLFRLNKKYNLKIAAIAALCIGSGFFINQSLVWLYGDGTGSTLSNFSYVLYSLAVGATGWTQALFDLPQLSSMTEAQRATFLYSMSVNHILSNPTIFFSTFIRNLLRDSNYFINQTIDFFTFLWLDNDGLIQQRVLIRQFWDSFFPITSIILLCSGIRFYLYKNNRDIIFLLFTVITAIFISLPFFYYDGGLRSTAATVPFIVVIFSVLFVGLMPKSYLQEEKNILNNSSLNISIFPLTMSIFFIVSVVFFPMIGPNFAKMVLKPPSEWSESHVCGDNQSVFFIRVDSGMPYIYIGSDEEKTNTFSPNIRYEDFKYHKIAGGGYESDFLSQIPQNSTLLLSHDMLSHNRTYIQFPGKLISKDRRYLIVCAECYSDKSVVYIAKNWSFIDHS